jgi:hypothetical protein
MRKQRERAEPRISVNKLAEYIVSRASRQGKILTDARWPSDYITVRYKEVYDLLADYLCDPEQHMEPLQVALRQYEAAIPGSDSNHPRSCAEALMAFLVHQDVIDLSGFEAARAPDRPDRLVINGVEVSVRPEVLLIAERRGRQVRGAVKLYLGKSHPFDEESGALAATLVRKHVEAQGGPGETDYRSCFVLDVFAGRLYTAPQANRRRLDDIAAACDQIRQLWPGLRRPPGRRPPEAE